MEISEISTSRVLVLFVFTVLTVVTAYNISQGNPSRSDWFVLIVGISMTAITLIGIVTGLY